MERGRTICSIVVCGILALLVIAGPVKAEDFFDRYLRGGHLSVEYSDDTTTSTVKTEVELELRFRDDDLSGFFRLTNDRPFAYQTDGFEIGKRGFDFDLSDDWELTGGDYSLVFARGTALNAVKNRDVDHDAQLDGLMVQGRYDLADLTLFWGRHKSDSIDYFLSGVNTNECGPSDGLRGGRIDLDLDDFDFGLSHINAYMTRWGEHLSTAATEIDLSYRIDNVTLYYESAWFDRNEPEWMEESNDGRAQLADILYAEPGFSLSGSWVRYDHAHFDYGTAPSLRRPDLDDANARADDETGYRLDCHLSPPSWEGNSLRVLYADLNGIEYKEMPFRNFFIEWSSPSTGDWSGTLSYDRISGFQQYYGAINGSDESWRATVDGPFPWGGSFHWIGCCRSLSNEFESDDEVELGFDWNINEEFTIGFFRETSTRENEPPPPGMVIFGESPGHWNSAYIRWTLDSWNQLDLLIGSQRGGFQCAGGTCAIVPPFKGVRLLYYRTL